MLLHLVYHAIKGIIKLAEDDEPVQHLDSALYRRKSRTILQYIDFATNAMINDGKKIDEVKANLLKKGLHEDHLDVVLDKAQRAYKKWVNETGGKPELTVFELYEQSLKNVSSTPIKMDTHPGEDHALHFCTLTNFESYYNINGRALLSTIANKALNTAPIIQHKEAAIRQSTFAQLGGTPTNPFLRVVTINNFTEAVYPYLRTTSKISFRTEQITEWDNGDPIVEAEIEGRLNNLYPLCFFATDYAVNQVIYKSRPEIEIRLSAFVLELVDVKRNTNDTRQQPRAMQQNKNYDNKSYFSFEGVILDIKAASVDRFCIGCIMALKLNCSDRPGSNNIIDAYVTNANIKANKILKGMLVTGVLWFQGEIATELPFSEKGFNC
jgi:hypothetical protein